MSDDLEGLKELRDRLTKSLTRIIIIRLSLLLAVVLTFSHAFQRLELPETKKALSQLQACRSGDKDVFEDFRKYVDDPFILPLVHAAVRAYATRKNVAGDFKEAPLLLACLEQSELVYSGVFQFKLGLLGFDVSIDLRPWFFVLPPVLILSELFVALARRKRDLVESLLAHTLSSGGREDSPRLADRIAIGRSPLNRSPFSEYPDRWIEKGCTVLAVGLIAQLVVVTRTTWSLVPGFLLLQFFTICAMFVFHAVAAGVGIRESLRRHVVESGGWASEPSRLYRGWVAARQSWRRLRDRTPPRASLATGALLVGASLVLSVTVDACEHRHTGSDLLTRNALRSKPSADVRWITTQDLLLVLLQDPADKHDTTWIERGIDSVACLPYVLSLYLAAVALALAAGFHERKRPGFSEAPARALGLASCFVSLFAVADAALLGPGDKMFFVSLSLWWIVCPWLTVWLLPFAIGIRFFRARDPDVVARWAKIRNALLIFLAPAAMWGAANLVYAAASRGLWGLLAWAVGVHLMTLGFHRLPVARLAGTTTPRAVSPAGVPMDSG